jgi:hypothetical protein
MARHFPCVGRSKDRQGALGISQSIKSNFFQLGIVRRPCTWDNLLPFVDKGPFFLLNRMLMQQIRPLLVCVALQPVVKMIINFWQPKLLVQLCFR